MRRTADVDGNYRYVLGRQWDDSLPYAVFVMLNPSTADASEDDPTVRRCIGFAKRLGAGGLLVLNLFALRATDPDELITKARQGLDVLGARNLETIRATLYGGPAVVAVVAAWGANAERFASLSPLHRVYVEGFRAEMEGLGAVALGLTKDGAPRHPLYMPRETVLLDLVTGEPSTLQLGAVPNETGSLFPDRGDK